ncbi:MAG: hypothetical protein U0326_01820 [Polyangiales bacterium]
MSPFKTLSQDFEAFRKGLEATEAPPEGILQRQRVREHLASAWQPAQESVIGSYRRGTNLRPTRELDYLFVLGARHQPYLTADPAKVLDDVAARVGVTWYQARTRKAPHGLAVTFHDMTVVLIPAFPKHGGGVFIPDTELRRWLPTDPDAHARVVAEANKRTHNLAAAVVRALKCWRRARQVPVRSFHLETMALRALTAAPDDLLAGCIAALDGVAAAVKVRCAPPCPVGDDVDMYLALDPARRAAIATAAGDAADALRDAAAHDAERSNEAACAAARAVFGAPFPEG